MFLCFYKEGISEFKIEAADAITANAGAIKLENLQNFNGEKMLQYSWMYWDVMGENSNM